MIRTEKKWGKKIQTAGRFFSIFLIGFFLSGLKECSSRVGGTTMKSSSSDISMAITADKKELEIGDNISISTMMTNKGRSFLWVYPRPWLYATSYLKIKDESGQDLNVFYTAELDVAQPTHKDLVRLEPGKSLTYLFRAKLQDTKLSNRGENFTKGTFLVFGSSAIHIPREGHYFVHVEWSQKLGLFLLPNDFDRSSVWNGQVTSNSVPIHMKY